jgi:putative colanic acid biosynthesis acetyltransferase WcaF
LEKKVDLSKFDNSWYNPGRGVVVRTLWYYTNACFLNSYLFPFSGLKVFLLRLFGAQIGKGCVIKPKVNIKYPWLLKVGDSCWLGEKVWIDNLAQVDIANNVCLSQGAMLLCGNHDYKKVTFDLMVKPIILGEGAWIGAKAMVCPGIKVGKYALLSVASVATDDLEAEMIYRGVPAEKVKARF